MVPLILSGGGVTCDHRELVKWVWGDWNEGAGHQRVSGIEGASVISWNIKPF